MNRDEKILMLLSKIKRSTLDKEMSYKKQQLYSLITNSAAISGSVATERDNQRLFDEGPTFRKHTKALRAMNLDLKDAYQESTAFAKNRTDISVNMLKRLSAIVSKHTGAKVNAPLGDFDSEDKVAVTAQLTELCESINYRRLTMYKDDYLEHYKLSFEALYQLASIRPWNDGNGRVSRLLMNQIQHEFGTIPTKLDSKCKEEYISTLAIAHQENDLTLFQNFMFDEQLKNLEKIISSYHYRIEDFEEVKVEKDDVYKSLEISDRLKSILEVIRENENVRVYEIAKILQFSRSIAEREVALLKTKKILHRKGSKKNGVWMVNMDV
jgi:Fic family protein